RARAWHPRRAAADRRTVCASLPPADGRRRPGPRPATLPCGHDLKRSRRDAQRRRLHDDVRPHGWAAGAGRSRFPRPRARLPAVGDAAAGPPPSVRFVRADATRLAFPDACFDVLVSRSAMEHIAPVERALAEMARVVRPGGVIHLRVDPYFWLRGCHKRGLVDIPWAHA